MQHIRNPMKENIENTQLGVKCAVMLADVRYGLGLLLNAGGEDDFRRTRRWNQVKE